MPDNSFNLNNSGQFFLAASFCLDSFCEKKMLLCICIYICIYVYICVYKYWLFRLPKISVGGSKF